MGLREKFSTAAHRIIAVERNPFLPGRERTHYLNRILDVRWLSLKELEKTREGRTDPVENFKNRGRSKNGLYN